MDDLRMISPATLLAQVMRALPSRGPSSYVVVMEEWACLVLREHIGVNPSASELVTRRPFTLVPGNPPKGRVFEVTVRA